MPTSLHADLELARRSMIVGGARVRVRADLSGDQARLLLSRGLAELSEDVDDFEPDDPQRSLKVTQYGYDLILGRITP
ncbi:MAG: hypothetical protein U1E96_09845 [Azonexus sp.]